MAGGRSGSSGFLWLVIGVCLGISGTLVSLILINRNHDRALEEPDTVGHARPGLAVERGARPRVALPSQGVEPAASSSPETAAEAAQVADDAAAAGLTSRRPPAQN